MKQPACLKPRDKIALVAPAKAIEESIILQAKAFWEEHGFQVVIGRNCVGQQHYFSGTDQERAEDLQLAIDDESIKAIICARGGYGCMRILDLVNWAGMINFPKWLVGFSDVTVFHHQLSKWGVQSIHATMPLNYAENSTESKTTLLQCLTKSEVHYEWNPKTYQSGIAEGALVGGNLAIITSLIGTSVFPSYKHKILFIEDIGEHLYAIDRMFYQLEKSGVLDQINGLIVGGFSGTKDTEVPFGQSLEEIILAHFKYRKIPIAFDFPVGHQPDNRALIVGQMVSLKVDPFKASLQTETTYD